MKINHIKNSNYKNTSFKGAFLLQGPEKDVKALYALIEKENTAVNALTGGFNLNNGLLVLTQGHMLSANKIINEKAANYVVKTSEIWDGLRQNISKNIIDFSPRIGQYMKYFTQKAEGMTFYLGKYNESNSEYLLLNHCEFNEPVLLSDGLKELGSKQIYLENRWRSFDFKPRGLITAAINTFKNDAKFNTQKVNKLLGAGKDSIVLGLNEKEALKISQKPCYPITTKSFDLPIIDKGINKPEKLYWCKNPKGENEFEERITEPEMKDLIDKIKKEGCETNGELYIAYSFQAVKWNDKVYLVDYDAVDEFGTSRMYDYSKDKY